MEKLYVVVRFAYEWYGKHTEYKYVGPFQNPEVADAWCQDYNKLSAEDASVIDKPLTNPVYPPETTPRQLHDTVWKAIMDYCQG